MGVSFRFVAMPGAYAAAQRLKAYRMDRRDAIRALIALGAATGPLLGGVEGHPASMVFQPAAHVRKRIRRLMPTQGVEPMVRPSSLRKSRFGARVLP